MLHLCTDEDRVRKYQRAHHEFVAPALQRILKGGLRFLLLRLIERMPQLIQGRMVLLRPILVNVSPQCVDGLHAVCARLLPDIIGVLPLGLRARPRGPAGPRGVWGRLRLNVRGLGVPAEAAERDVGTKGGSSSPWLQHHAGNPVHNVVAAATVRGRLGGSRLRPLQDHAADTIRRRGVADIDDARVEVRDTRTRIATPDTADLRQQELEPRLALQQRLRKLLLLDIRRGQHG
mmetsp:Transcript_107914/g.344464  ORF Transcript_107914/g.344464 Transcript_107914/m.344464 type:complete len:233 (+) Transcript_107914:440-1138(+)